MAILLGLLALPGMGAPDRDAGPPPGNPAESQPRANRLIDSADPYLLAHAHNPVDWYPWGPEALEKARRENKPIFLSVGYSTCYWCHVAERTLYSDPEIASLMNEWFINVKVDREERPDIDSVYMLARQILTGEGGWPNNLFLTPEGEPFYAGSYFPPADDEFGHHGFPTVLKAVHRVWTENPQALMEQASRVHAALQALAPAPGKSTAKSVEPTAWRSAATERILARVDARYGGFTGDNGTKFPQEPRLALLLADYRANRSTASLEAATKALDAIAFGGIHDHLGGGFHRYSTDSSWSVPHFEKMLYNNAQLLRLYADDYALTANPVYRYWARQTAAYLHHRMMDPDGGFYTAEDAEAGGEEGATYLWTREEIVSALGPADAKRLFAVYALAPMEGRQFPQSDDGSERGVLRIRQPLPDALAKLSGEQWVRTLDDLAPLRAKLLAARARREQPARDEKLVVALNGLAIEALAEAGTLLTEPEYILWAKRAGERIWQSAFETVSGRLKHQVFQGRPRVAAFLDDYALLGIGFVALHDATGEDLWLRRARTLADSMITNLGRPDGGFSTSPEAGRLVIAPPEQSDRAMPSGTSAALALLQSLSRDNSRYATAAANLLRQMAPEVEADPEQWPAFVAVARTGTQLAAARGPSSADHVHVSARVVGMGDHDDLVVSLVIDAGYHTNAHPASFDYLVPTVLQVEGVAPSRISYPGATRFKAAFAPDGLDVYEGTVTIVAAYTKGTLGPRPRGKVTAQACNHETCLPPADIPWSASR